MILTTTIGFFTLEKITKANDIQREVLEKAEKNVVTRIKLQQKKVEENREKEEIEKIKKKLQQYGNHKKVKIKKEEEALGIGNMEKPREHAKVYSVKLEKGTELSINNNFFSRKEIEKHNKKEIIYTNKNGDERFKILINYFEKPKLAILIDDVGMNTKVSQYFLDIKRPLSFAVLPYLPKTKETNKIFSENKYEVILHMPMEGSNDRLNKKTKGLMWTDMTKKEIYDEFDGAIEDTGEVSGFNNHMGSKFTGNPNAMKKILSYAKRKNFYYIDSNTNSKRQGYKIAKELNIPTFYTSYFIDNSDNKEDIKKAIKKAVEMAKENKKVLVIGHYRKNTGEAIKEMLDYIDKEQVKLVSVKDVLD